MKCSLCGLEFSKEDGISACRSCPLSKGCNMVRCPNCGYEIPLETGLVKLIKSWSKRNESRRET